MKTIDVRLTLTPEALAIVLVQLRNARPGRMADVCRPTADAMETCARHQRVVREAYEAGKPLAPALRLVQAAEDYLPFPGEGKR